MPADVVVPSDPATATGTPTDDPSDPATTTGLREAFPGTLLLALAALAAVAPLATDAYLPAFTAMASDLKVSASTVQLTMTTFLMGVAVGQLLIGVLSDRLGRRPLLLWGTVLALLAGVGAALAPGISVLLVARFLQGLGGASGMVLGRAVISDRARGIVATQALSLVMAIQGIAPVAAPILGGILVDVIGWRGILGVVAGFTGLLVLMVLLWVPETLPAHRRQKGGLKVLGQGARALGRDRVLVRLVVLNSLVYALLMSYLAAAPFVLQSVLGLGTAAYTAVFAACGITITVVVSAAASQARRVSPARQVRAGLPLLLAVDVVFAVVCVVWLRQPVDSGALTSAVVLLFLAHAGCIGLSIGNLPALALDRTGQWAGTGSALLGFVQFVMGGLASPLVGLSGNTSALAFGVVIVVVGVAANALALLGLRAPGDKERAQARVRAQREQVFGGQADQGQEH